MEQKFSTLSGGAKAWLIVGFVLLLAWLAFSALMVLVATALGVGACSSDEACANRATIALIATPVVHLAAAGLGAYAAFGQVAMRWRVLTLVGLALLTPVVTFAGSFLLVAGLS